MKKLLVPAVTTAALGLIGLVAPSSEAAILAQYEFSNNFAATNVDASITATDDVTFTGAASPTFNGSSGPNAPSLQLNPLNAGDFISFGFTAGATATLDDVTFVLENTGNGPTSFTASYRLGGSGAFTAIETFTAPANLFVARIADDTLPGGFTGEVDFRLTFGAPGNPTANTRRVRIDDITVNGTIPEPASAALVAAGLGLIGLRRRSH